MVACNMISLTSACYVSVTFSQDVLDILGTALFTVAPGLKQYQSERLYIGDIKELIAEASDANATGVAIIDGKSGNVNFPHGNLKPIATVGERSACANSKNEKFVGVPDGLGAYLADNSTVSACKSWCFKSSSYPNQI
jgi:hypothetical protein